MKDLEQKKVSKKRFIKKKLARAKEGRKTYCPICDYYFNCNLRAWFGQKKYGPPEQED